MAETTVAVRKSVTVQAPRERAFAAFTEEIGLWWPLENAHIGAQPPAEAVIEQREGGRWFERAADGTECDWGHVLAWEPPGRVLLSWEISHDFKPDPSVASEVEVTFADEGDGTTRVELVHRGLEAYGDEVDKMREIFASPSGWSGMLGGFVSVAEGR